MKKMYVFNRIYPFKKEEKISLSKANLNKLNDFDFWILYDLTLDRNRIKNSIKRIENDFEIFKENNALDFYYYRIKQLNSLLKQIDDKEQEILQKTL